MNNKIQILALAGLLAITGNSFGQEPNCIYLASDVYPGSFGGLPVVLTEYNGALYFNATGNAMGAELWKYENATLTMVADICVGIASSLPNELTIMGSDLYFTANNCTNGVELFRFDGSTVSLVADIAPGVNGSYPNKLTVVGSTLFFAANDGTNGMEPWKYDGVTATMVADINPGSGGSNPTDIEGLGTTAFFAATNPAYGHELWKYDGTTTTVVDIRPGALGSDLGELTTVGTRLCLRATNGTNGYELFSHDGTTLTLHDMNPGAADFTPWELTKSGSTLFFRGFTAASGYELWKFNGTTASLVMDIYPGSSNSHPNNITADATGSGIYFAANNGVVGNELWYSNGTTAALAADVVPGSGSSMPAPSFDKFAVMGDEVFFVAGNAATGNEVWRYDGTTHELGKDIAPGTPSSSPNGLKVMGTTLFFQADNTVTGGELWAWDPYADLTDTLNVYTCDDYTSPGGTLYDTPGTYNFTDIIPSTHCPGCDSLITIDLTITDQPSSSFTVTACDEYTTPNGAVYTVVGNYIINETVPSVSCPPLDSLITIDLTIVDGISTAVVVFTNVVVAQQSGASYQWLDCDNGYAPVPGATDQDYLPDYDGNYACELTLGCVDTSDCYFVEGNLVEGILEKTPLDIRIYPNPATDKITVEASRPGIIDIEIYDNLGQLVVSEKKQGVKLSFDVSSLSRGMYYIKVVTEDGCMIETLVRP